LLFHNEYANQEELNFKSDQQPLKNNDRDMKQLSHCGSEQNLWEKIN